ncbi:hypothetical protein AVEN_207775-1 [Araneus ventricosus]|uniref:Uncharacterized protein n=1 Tax=Araneus ventricosus TaxID=182803 RepID=A0A4Y2BXE8_ARAVE|nr:hypothetical protein AVEN_207775-1 [Araneus ventricosus]
MSLEFGIVPISQCLLPKSELIREFKSELITQLFSALRSLKTKFETPKSVLHRAPFSIPHSVFIPYLKGWSSSFLSLHWTIVFPDRPTAKSPDSQWSIPTVGKVLEFPHHRSYIGVT